MLSDTYRDSLWYRASRRAMSMTSQRFDGPTVVEDELIHWFRDAVREAPGPADGTDSAAGAEWLRIADGIRELVLSKDPRHFLRWRIVQDTMAVPFARFVDAELAELQGRPDWPRWNALVREVTAGSPVPHAQLPDCSANSIHHTYVLSKFMQYTGVDLSDIGLALEFGGGYGNVCRLLNRLGHADRPYVIFDLRVMSFLQSFYLRLAGIPVVSPDGRADADAQVHCVSEPTAARRAAEGHGSRPRLLVALWSLSEAPLADRSWIEEIAPTFDYFLMGYQSQFGEVDNQEWLARWQSALPGVAWQIEPLVGTSHHYMLFGKPD